MATEQNTVTQGTLAVRDLTKSFGGVRVLDRVSLALKPGRVHALLGHNGSGKSTLIKILAGVYAHEEGSVTRGDLELKAGSPKSAHELGIRFVHQRKNVIEQLPAPDNAGFGGVFEKVGPFIAWKRQRQRAVDAVQRIQADTTVDTLNPMGDGPEIHKTFLAIGRAVGQVDAQSILVLDEPTASLSPDESDELLDAIRRLRDRGVSILYVSHRLREIREIADDITVLSDGKVVLTGEAQDVSYDDIVAALTPETIDGSSSNDDSALGYIPGNSSNTPFLVAGLETELLRDIDLSVQAGEIVGVAGLDGSGREDVARALGGMLTSAEVRSVTTNRGSATRVDPRGAARLGIALALESRAPGAVVGEMTIAENIALRQKTTEKPLRPAETKTLATQWIRRLGILPNRPDTTLELMSGGNRQKVVIASALAVRPAVLVVEDPTAGVDIAAAQRVRDVLVRAAKESGLAVLWVSADLEELQQVSDRVLCIANGRITSELGKELISERHILEAIS